MRGAVQEEKHPSSMGIGKSKEGFSMFGMLNLCVTSMGRKLMRQWFLRPIVNLSVMKERHETIAVLMHSSEAMAQTQVLFKLPKWHSHGCQAWQGARQAF